MDPVDFGIDTSKGMLSIDISWGAWTLIRFDDWKQGDLEVDELIRNERELADGLVRVGLPPQEAETIAADVWSQLDGEDRAELAAIRGLDEPVEAWRARTGRRSWWERFRFGSKQ